MQTAVDESRNTKDTQGWHDREAVEKFITRVYNAANAEGCHEARAALFSGCRSSEAFPPTSDAARWHITCIWGALSSNGMETSSQKEPHPPTCRNHGMDY